MVQGRFFHRIGNCFPIRQKSSGRMRTRAKRKNVVNDRAGCENVHVFAVGQCGFTGVKGRKQGGHEEELQDDDSI